MRENKQKLKFRIADKDNPLKPFYQDLKDLTGIVNEALSYVDELESTCDYFVNFGLEAGNNLLNFAKDNTNKIVNKTLGAVEYPIKKTYEIANNAMKHVMFPLDVAKNATNATKNLVQSIRSYVEKFSKLADPIQEEIIAIQMDAEAIKKCCDSIAKIGKTQDTEQINYKSYAPTKTDDLISISKKFFGSTDYAQLLSEINGCDNNNLPPVLKIPVEKQKSVNTNIFDTDHLDTLGVDIKLNNGYFVFSNNDFSLVRGEANIEQAINHRLSDRLQARKRLNSYGVLAQVGIAKISDGYMKTNIASAILQDARVEAVNKIETKTGTTEYFYKTEIQTINNTNIIVEGALK
jgi:hypothetical protein